jgi:hypothetical protein
MLNFKKNIGVADKTLKTQYNCLKTPKKVCFWPLNYHPQNCPI